ncbi:hypothetical protein [Methanogenium cariaci]|uniref:hypothetical protein n=1 Tax=Methanogenium cariaci TaxID=2197 RepID=UPI001FDEA7D8|nr:hypothetical protein [Methanogenium cariaci]
METLNDDGQWIVMMGGFIVAIGMFMLAIVISQAPLVGQTTAESVMEFPKNEVQDLRGGNWSRWGGILPGGISGISDREDLQERFRGGTSPCSRCPATTRLQIILWTGLNGQQRERMRISFIPITRLTSITTTASPNIPSTAVAGEEAIGMTRIYRNLDDEGVSMMTEYLSITSLLVCMFVIMMFVVNAGLIEGPSDTLKYHSYVDIGNGGVSVRMVDLYAIAPGGDGTIRTQFDLPPDTVAGEEYDVILGGIEESQYISVTDGSVLAEVAIAGIGASRGVTGRTTGSGYNIITYNSSGV